VRCNSNGDAIDNRGPLACGGIFRNASAIFWGAFQARVSSALNFELIGAMVAIEIAHDKVYSNFWLEWIQC